MKRLRSEHKGLCLIALLIAVAALIRVGITYFSDDRPFTLLKENADSLSAFESQTGAVHSAPASPSAQEAQRIAPQGPLFAFDPNHADSATLHRVGFTDRQVRNLMAYRRKGGIWHSPDDLARLYGLHPEDFQKLRPYIRIAQADRRQEYHHDWEERPYPYGTPKGEKPVLAERTEKLAEGTVISLNQADTTQLKMIPGIGSYYAGKIVKYRERLGGFISTRQLSDIEGLPAGIARWFEVEPGAHPTQIHINRADFKALVHHPYLSYEQTKVIKNHIRQYGPIRSWHDLRLYKEFTDADFQRLAPYFDFK